MSATGRKQTLAQCPQICRVMLCGAHGGALGRWIQVLRPQPSIATTSRNRTGASTSGAAAISSACRADELGRSVFGREDE
jgi:hypothetical protein